jgi:hypothetical protein
MTVCLFNVCAPDGALPGEQRVSAVAAACLTGGTRAPQRGSLAGSAVARRRRAGGLPICGALDAGAPGARSRGGRAWHDPGHRVAGRTCGPSPCKALARPSPRAHPCSGGAKQQSNRPRARRRLRAAAPAQQQLRGKSQTLRCAARCSGHPPQTRRALAATAAASAGEKRTPALAAFHMTKSGP